MRRIIVVLLLVILVVIGGGVFYGLRVNPETMDLDTAARASAPGRFVGSSRGTTHYEIAGPDTGRTVVLVHGFSVPAYIWDSTSVALSAAGFRVIRYDVMGRGWSDRPDTQYDSTLFSTQLDELLDSLKVNGPVDLMGLSFGGAITAHYIATHPARVRTWTLLDPVASSRTLPAILKLPVLGPWFFQTTAVPGMADGQASDFLHPEQFPDWADRYRPQMKYRGFGRAILRTAIYGSEFDIAALYRNAGKTGKPTLLIWGKQDTTVPIALADVVRSAIPQTEFFPVDSAGHLPHMEKAGEVLARLLQFLASHN
ncbi:MAG: alpha/beta hydrolase [Gemmatimonadaceae bacterium]|nr:alpha/beta hydrolase [Gemmatimonadaceae bacterium]